MHKLLRRDLRKLPRLRRQVRQVLRGTAGAGPLFFLERIQLLHAPRVAAVAVAGAQEDLDDLADLVFAQQVGTHTSGLILPASVVVYNRLRLSTRMLPTQT